MGDRVQAASIIPDPRASAKKISESDTVAFVNIVMLLYNNHSDLVFKQRADPSLNEQYSQIRPDCEKLDTVSSGFTDGEKVDASQWEFCGKILFFRKSCLIFLAYVKCANWQISDFITCTSLSSSSNQPSFSIFDSALCGSFARMKLSTSYLLTALCQSTNYIAAYPPCTITT